MQLLMATLTHSYEEKEQVSRQHPPPWLLHQLLSPGSVLLEFLSWLPLMIDGDMEVSAEQAFPLQLAFGHSVSPPAETLAKTGFHM